MRSLHVRRAAATAATVLTALLLGASSAHAAGPYWSTGYTGYSNTGSGTCWYYNAAIRLDVWATAPEVFARNFTPGGGNDWQWVRYRSFLVKLSNGSTLGSSGWSEWRQATDVAKAAFSYDPKFTNVSDGTVIDIRVEWWNQTQMLGAAAHRISPYRYFNGGVGPYGPMNSCARINI